YQGNTVHFWTFPHTTKDGAVTATTHSKKHLAKMLKEAYGADNIEFYVIVAEQHAQSERAWERTYHWHALLKLTRRIKWKALARQLREKHLFGHLALPRLHADFFRCLRYLVAPTTRKGQDQLDSNPYFSSQFPVDMMEKRMRKYFNISLRPSDMYSIVRQMKFTSYQQLIDWAVEQRRRGNSIYEKFLAKQGQKMPGLFASWMQILCEPATAAGLRKQRLELWSRAAQTPCSCVSPNRLQDALERLLEHHGKCPGRWAFCLTKLLRIGTTAKNSNILLWGESNSGKTALTRPLIHIFENHVFLRPNRGDTFVLQGLEKMLISVFQDWRLSTTPLPYDTLLLLLEGESVSCAVKNSTPVLVHHPPPFIITTQTKVVPKTPRGDPDEEERKAFQNRFGLRWCFKNALSSAQRDPALKLCYSCKGCYVRWINRCYEQYVADNPGIDSEIRMVEATLERESSTCASSQVSNLCEPASRGHKRKSEEPCTPPRHHRLEEPGSPLLVQEVNASSPLLTPSPLPRMNPDCPYAVTHAWKDGELLEVTPLKQSAEDTIP
ncbi:unnamed protein product, partial [Symbiodinium sp. CCMP2456]